MDRDGDGHLAPEYGGEDCNDNDERAHPGHQELYDGIDNNCSCATGDCCDDDDHDCDGELATEVNGPDCDDNNSEVGPHQPERCSTERDDDCDGVKNEDWAIDGTQCFPDVDLDGAGPDDEAIVRCACRTDEVLLGGDCNDRDGSISPLTDESWYDDIDQDCSGGSDFDADLDGFDSAAHGGEDCDDNNKAIHPDATEVWYDGTDQDCDGLSDYDQDKDGDISDAHEGDDCDDLDPLIGPSAEEFWYDGIDQTCDGNDEDPDGDGFLPPSQGGDDCDDFDATVYLGADEVCDNVDNDCDTLADDDDDDVVAAPSWFEDSDLDGFGAGSAIVQCGGPVGWVLADGDCNDDAQHIYPGAEEVCFDWIDDDCDGVDDCTVPFIETELESLISGSRFYVSTAGDINNDGVADLLLTPSVGDAHQEDWYDILLGPVGRGYTDLLSEAVHFDGPVLHGPWFRPAGDIDGDGLADLLYPEKDTSKIRVLLGGDAVPSEAFFFRHGTELLSSAAGGDLDGDGISEVAGTFQDATWNVYVVYGPSSKNQNVETDSDLVVTSPFPNQDLLLGADTDGDGFGELAIASSGASRTCPKCRGQVDWFTDAPTGNLDISDADISISASQNYINVGYSLAAADMDGDGLDDMVVGCENCVVIETLGWIYSGPITTGDAESGLALTADGTELLDLQVTTGDINGDGQADLTVHASSEAPANGQYSQAWLLLGPIDENTHLPTDADFHLPHATREASAFQFVGDIDADGFDDIGVGDGGGPTFKARILWGHP
jgi:hypothetical protein